MGANSDIKLPRAYRPKFPDRCISCGAARPNDTMAFYSEFHETIHLWPPRHRFAVEVPVCAGCRGDLRQRRWIISLASTIMWIALIAAAAWVVTHYNGPYRKLILLAIGTICLIPWFLAYTWYCLPISLKATPYEVTYEFLDKGYREEFTRLNNVPPKPRFDALDTG
jgi:hypothetical protein